MDKAAKRLKWLAFFTFFLAPIFAWGSVIASDETAVFASLLVGFLVFSLITGVFAVLNVFDDKSYVIASAVSELYVLTMMSLIGYLTYYLAYRKAKSDLAM